MQAAYCALWLATVPGLSRGAAARETHPLPTLQQSLERMGPSLPGFCAAAAVPAAPPGPGLKGAPAPRGFFPGAAARLQPGDWAAYQSYLDAVTGTQSSGKNSIEFLVDAEASGSELAAIAGAEWTVHIEVYQYQADEVGWTHARLLARKAAQGVRVRLLLDAYGTKTDGPGVKRLIRFLRRGGVEVEVRPAPLFKDHLDHRKVMVIDGAVGIVGGMNIGKLYAQEWHDQQCLIRGPAVAKLQEAFLAQWRAAGGRRIPPEERLFPKLAEPTDGVETRVIPHQGCGRDRRIKDAYLGAFATARRLIRIADPYFAEPEIVAALAAAARRGVKVQIVLPLHNDMKLVQDASRAFYPDLLTAGVEIYEYQPRMAHEKVALADDYWVTFGSSNLDARSLADNDELNVVATDARFAAVVESRLFEPDLKNSRRILSYAPSLAEKAARRAWRLLVNDGGDFPPEG
ncbi:MAG: phospholipase D-like domain-containing protein [Elusimicrobia bacterium]|nr:phospholipase D-like domain-containing protein [Elusimicrobiota bacterium]